MTVFKTFLKILKKNIATVILFTVLLIIFSALNMQTSENNMSFTPSKPDVAIINNDENEGITQNLIKYISDNSNIINIENNEEKLNDALFYRELNYIIYIPENYNKDFLDGKNPEINIKSTGDYQASFEEMILSRYIKVANIYRNNIQNEEELINKINETLLNETKTVINSKLDTDNLAKATFYYNFASYSILTCLIFIIGLILNSFNEEKIRKRIIVSKMNYREHNRKLLLSSCVYTFALWLFYVIISFIIVGDIMFTEHGLIYIINSFILSICATTIAFFIGNLINNKTALNGIVNVIGLGSSFLCGAFVPAEILPSSVLNIAHALPTYYYINTNEILKTIEEFNLDTLKPIIVNMIIILGFAFIFIIFANIVSRKKRK